MSTSQRTFNQVKLILGKLDQRIDTLRSARTTERVRAIGGAGVGIGVGVGVGIGAGAQAIGPTTLIGAGSAASTGANGQGAGMVLGGVAGVAGPGLSTTVGSAGTPNASAENGNGTPNGAEGPAGRSIYGRATPIRPTGT